MFDALLYGVDANTILYCVAALALLFVLTGTGCIETMTGGRPGRTPPRRRKMVAKKARKASGAGTPPRPLLA